MRNGPKTARSFSGESFERIATWSKRRATPATGLGKGDGHLVPAARDGRHRAAAGPEGVARGRMQRGIHQHLHGVDDVIGGERRAVGEGDAFAQLEDDRAAAVLDAPGFRQLRLEPLRQRD